MKTSKKPKIYKFKGLTRIDLMAIKAGLAHIGKEEANDCGLSWKVFNRCYEKLNAQIDEYGIKVYFQGDKEQPL